MESGLELKFAGGKPVMTEGAVIEGYASRFGLPDQGGDIVAKGAFGASLARLAAKGDKVRMLWQHDPTKPIGVWDEIRDTIMGNTVLSYDGWTVLVSFVAKIIINVLIWFCAILIAPLGVLYLWFRTRG